MLHKQARSLFVYAFLFFFLSLSCCAYASVSIVVVGGTLAPRIDATNLTGGAGTDFQPSMQMGTLFLQIRSTGKSWTVYARKALTFNFPVQQISVTRLTGDSDMSGGLGPVVLTNTNTEFFTGIKKSEADVQVQCQVSGLSLFNAPPGTYDSSIIFEVIEF